ncbi:hypothetical protein [Nannocystis bainbridge]|uniref:Uncharacterized protein n=1 Tax=Nannocystis bainbridge TaxID=2995303 RepID=A0ABT5EFN5_9BACT|nr:hypothetical protein [Nannocystis bainbridge]MDC0723753.1 hypothetical protein [Nannocystis bainbridge]
MFVFFVVACSKNTGAPGETSATAAEPSSSSAGESTTGHPGTTTSSSGAEPTSGTLTSTGSTGTTGTSEPTSGTSAADSTTGAPATPCHLAFNEADCKAGVDCVFIPGHEPVVRDGECVSGELGEVGFCYFMEGGGPDAPSGYFEVETGRVFVFPNTPVPPPEGWQECTCEAPSPEACQCVGECSGTSTSS